MVYGQKINNFYKEQSDWVSTVCLDSLVQILRIYITFLTLFFVISEETKMVFSLGKIFPRLKEVFSLGKLLLSDEEIIPVE